MSDEETKQNGQTKAEGLTKTQVQVICAIIGAAAVVIAARLGGLWAWGGEHGKHNISYQKKA